MVDGWGSLPAVVRQAAGRHLGTVDSVSAVPGGQNNDLAAVFHTRDGAVFVKAVRGISRRMRWLRNEITAGTLAPGIAPAVIFAEDVEVDSDPWLVVGFQYLPGRPADLSPGSADLAIVGQTLDRISALPAPGIRGLHDRWSVRDWWRRLPDVAPHAVTGFDVDQMDQWASLAPQAVQGDRLVHTDLHADQFIVGAGGEVHVIDWGFPGAAAGWVDPAFLVIRLIDAGHTPHDAEEWAAARPGWPTDSAALTAFAALVAGLWTYREAVEGAGGPWVRAARNYAAWHVGRSD
ncbi:Aminoglycoside phosphotransferase domain-containing protein [Frankia sp. AiPs1]